MVADDEFDITKLFEVIEKRDRRQKRSNPAKRESDSLLLSSSINSLFGDDVTIDLQDSNNDNDRSNNNDNDNDNDNDSGNGVGDRSKSTSSKSPEKTEDESPSSEELESLIRNAFAEEKDKFMKEMRVLETAFTKRVETRLLGIVKKK